MIAVDHIRKPLGIHIRKAEFFRDLLAIVGELLHASLDTLLLAVCVLAPMFGLERSGAKAAVPGTTRSDSLVRAGLGTADGWFMLHRLRDGLLIRALLAGAARVHEMMRGSLASPAYAAFLRRFYGRTGTNDRSCLARCEIVDTATAIRSPAVTDFSRRLPAR